MLTTTKPAKAALELPDRARAGAHSGTRHGAPTTRAGAIDWWRVGILGLVASVHIVGLGLLALPDSAPPVAPTQRRFIDTPASDRLTLTVDLGQPLAPPLPLLPLLPPAPTLRAVVPPAVDLPDVSPRPATPAVVSVAPAPDSIPVATHPVVASKDTPATPVAIPAPAASSGRSGPSGDPAQIRSDREAYMRALLAALLQHRSYPAEARKQRARGVVHLRFAVDRNGHVLSSSIARGAGSEILEAAALEVLRSADPLPPIPDSLGVDRLTVTVPIEYSLITR